MQVFLLSPLLPSQDPSIALGATSGEAVWKCMMRGSRIQTGDVFSCNHGGLSASVEAKNGAEAVVRLSWDDTHNLAHVLSTLGSVPLPPYLHREAEEDDVRAYQTEHARVEGSVAAPTAGLHFSKEVVDKFRTDRSSGTCMLTLHVGAGTFKPVTAVDASQHDMHSERIAITDVSLYLLRDAAHRQVPLVIVGTTVSSPAMHATCIEALTNAHAILTCYS